MIPMPANMLLDTGEFSHGTTLPEIVDSHATVNVAATGHFGTRYRVLSGLKTGRSPVL